MTQRMQGLALALVGLVPWGCAPTETKEAQPGTTEGSAAAPVPAAPRAVPVTVAPLAHRPVERTVEVNGDLKGWEGVTIGSKQSGRVVEVLHDMGDQVRPGAALLRMSTVDATLTVRQAERQLQVELAKLGLEEMPDREFDFAQVPSVIEAQVALDRAERNYQRELQLYRKKAGTAQAVQDAEADQKAADAALKTATLAARSALANAQTAQVSLQIAQQSLADMEIQAPVPSAPPRGQAVSYAVTKRMVAEGQMLQMGGEVFELVIENPLRLWVNVPERHRGEIRRGQTARITVAAYPAKVFEGTVARINPAVDETSRTFQVEIATPNDEGLLRPGGFAKASILTQRDADATVVPQDAIVEYAGVTKVFVVEDDKARAISVQKGLEGSGWVEILGDLPKEAQVVTSGHSVLANDTPVVIREPAKPGATAPSSGPRPDAPAPAGAAAAPPTPKSAG